MNMHDGYAKCTQLMVSLFHNKGLMYIRNAYLLKLFLANIWLLTEVLFSFLGGLGLFYLHHAHSSDQTPRAHHSAEG